jgi:hypothetical protein
MGAGRGGLSSVVLTHHSLKNKGKRNILLGEGDPGEKLQPLTEPGSGEVQDKQKALWPRSSPRLTTCSKAS